MSEFRVRHKRENSIWLATRSTMDPRMYFLESKDRKKKTRVVSIIELEKKYKPVKNITLSTCE